MKGAFCMPQKGRISDIEKLRIVERCESGEITIAEAARICESNTDSIYRWISRYRSEGALSFAARAQNRVYSTELKREAVKAYLSNQGGLRKICEIFHISDTRILRRWIKVYNSGESFTVKMSGGSRMKNTRKTTQEERIEIAKACIESENNYGFIASKYGVSYQQARTWTLKFKELGNEGLEDRRGQLKRDQTPRTELEQAQIEIERLKHRLYMTKMENDVLKKLQEIERRDALDK